MAQHLSWTASFFSHAKKTLKLKFQVVHKYKYYVSFCVVGRMLDEQAVVFENQTSSESTVLVTFSVTRECVGLDFL